MNGRKSSDNYLENINSWKDEKAGVCQHFGAFDASDVVLEVGPGGGGAMEKILAELAKVEPGARPKIVTIDLSMETLLRVQGLFTDVNEGLEDDEKIDGMSVLADAFGNLPFQDGSISAINVSSVLHEGFSYAGGEGALCTFIKESSRVLRDNGIVVYRDPEGTELDKFAASFLKEPTIRNFMVIFFKKYFQDALSWDDDNPNAKYRKDLSISLDGEQFDPDSLTLDAVNSAENVFVNCSAGLMYELKRHFVIFMKTFFPEVFNDVEVVGEDKIRCVFKKPIGGKIFSEFCEERGEECISYKDGFFVEKDVFDEFEKDILTRFSSFFEPVGVQFRDQDSFDKCVEFLESASVEFEKGSGFTLSVALEEIVLIYDKFESFLDQNSIIYSFSNDNKEGANQEGVCDWFEREGTESYFYGDEIDIVVKFFEESLARVNKKESILEHSCLIPISSNFSQFVSRDCYTSYVLTNVVDIEGGYVDGKRSIHFVKRPIEYAFPVLLKLYEKSGDIRLRKLITRVLLIIAEHLGAPMTVDFEEGMAEEGLLDKSLSSPNVIGLVGGIASGKSTLATILKESGYEVFEISDCIGEQIEAKGILEPSRSDYFDLANAFRREHGNDFWAQCVVDKIPDDPNGEFLISGIRTVDEVEYLREKFSRFMLVGVDAPMQTRIKRVHSRLRDIDPKGIKRIRENMRRELEDGFAGCQLAETLKVCDTVLDSSDTVDVLRAKWLDFLERIGKN